MRSGAYDIDQEPSRLYDIFLLRWQLNRCESLQFKIYFIIYPSYLKMQVSELSTNVRARRNVKAMTSPCQTL